MKKSSKPKKDDSDDDKTEKKIPKKKDKVKKDESDSDDKTEKKIPKKKSAEKENNKSKPVEKKEEIKKKAKFVVVDEDDSKEKSKEEKKEEIKKKPKFVVNREIPEIKEDWSIIRIATEAVPLTYEKVFAEATDELHDISGVIARVEKKKKMKCLPLRKHIFMAFCKTPFGKVKIVLIGQDPYPDVLPSGKPRAQGSSFSVSRKDKITSSLSNLFKELERSIDGYVRPKHGDLSYWQEQGVLLLNMSLTVLAKVEGDKETGPDCFKQVWMGFNKVVIDNLCEEIPNLIFILLGAKAQKLEPELSSKSIKLKASHPSGLSANRGNSKSPALIGSGIFKRANDLLKSQGKKKIDWQT